MDTLRELFVRSLNMAVAASWLVLALLLLRPLLKKFAPKWVLCALWVLVAVRLVCPVMLHSNLSAYRLAGDAVQEDGQVVYFRSYSDTGHTVVGYDPRYAAAPYRITRCGERNGSRGSGEGNALRPPGLLPEKYIPPVGRGRGSYAGLCLCGLCEAEGEGVGQHLPAG